MTTSGKNSQSCGCCTGTSQQSPQPVGNRPGLSAIAYRVGTHAQFKSTMLAALAALPQLTTRKDDDFSIALLDAWAAVADVLTFYQERIANESYLRTATERRSILELARLIGYRLRPGVAAETWLAFNLETTAGAPEELMLVPGVKVQSVPGPGEKPQTFETVETITARPAWNVLKPEATEPIALKRMSKEAWVNGISLQLKPGDALLFVGEERAQDPENENWDFRPINTVTEDTERGLTRVTWLEGLGHPHVPPASHPHVFVFRQRAFLFGYNAPDWRAIPEGIQNRYKSSAAKVLAIATSAQPGGAAEAEVKSWLDNDWPAMNLSYSVPSQKTQTIYLDALYPKIVEGSWVVLVRPGPQAAGYTELYKVTEAREASQTNFTFSAKTSRLTLDGENLYEQFDDYVRSTVVYSQSEELLLAENPLFALEDSSVFAGFDRNNDVLRPVSGAEIVLDRFAAGFPQGRVVIISGKLIRIVVRDNVTPGDISLISSDGTKLADLKPGESLQLVSPPVVKGATAILRLRSRDGIEGTVTGKLKNFVVAAAEKGDAPVSEAVTVDAVSTAAETLRTIFTLSDKLQHCYDRATLSILANVARATHGEMVDEVLGSGDAGLPYQRFTLKRPPLTYVGADTPSGSESTLKVYVNDIQWREKPVLFGHAEDERIFSTFADDDQKTAVKFGDGRMGARLPSGQANVRAQYRTGIGVQGNVRADQLTSLLTRPLGLKDANNPLPATGGDDGEPRDKARQNAPFAVVTLDRIVSLQDYQDFARTFGGIAKALATWTWDGSVRQLLLTVAGPDGAAVDPKGPTADRLIAAIAKASDVHIPVRIASYRPATFRLKASVKSHPDYIREHVLAAIEAALRNRVSFDARHFGCPVFLSEVVEIIQSVEGVLAANVTNLYRTDGTQSKGTEQPLRAAMPETGSDGKVLGAELLLLDDTPFGEPLGVLP